MEDLEKRVEQFQLLMLPGQPMFKHMGTAYLVSDLWKEVKKLRKEVSNLNIYLVENKM